MSTTKHEGYKKRRDPYDPRTGATANDDPNGSEAGVRADREAGSNPGWIPGRPPG